MKLAPEIQQALNETVSRLSTAYEWHLRDELLDEVQAMQAAGVSREDVAAYLQRANFRDRAPVMSDEYAERLEYYSDQIQRLIEIEEARQAREAKLLAQIQELKQTANYLASEILKIKGS